MKHINHAHQITYDAILRHPAAHNLQWREVRNLLEAIAGVEELAHGAIKVTRNGQSVVLHPENRKEMNSWDELKDLRNFLENSDERLPPAEESGVNLLVVIDHRSARVYRTEMKGAVPATIVPNHSESADRHVHYVDNDSNGQRRPELKSYYDEVAKSLQHATRVVVFGHGTGGASAMTQLMAELRLHHKDIAGKVIGTVSVDDSHKTDDQLLEKAREFYASHGVVPVGGPAVTVGH
jgi:hypothetical protein